MEERLILLLTAVLPLALLAFWLGSRAWAGFRRVHQARDWPVVPGRIVRSEVQEVMVRVRRNTSINTTRTALRYRPRVIYQYVVGGVPHQGERLHFGDTTLSSDTAAANRIVARFQPSATVSVYYNPADPSDAVLERRVGWGTHILWISALLVLILMVSIVVAIWG
ncbi:MAG: hypothetical protein OHK0022_19020 [Roseiflexaceae bacterium]